MLSWLRYFASLNFLLPLCDCFLACPFLYSYIFFSFLFFSPFFCFSFLWFIVSFLFSIPFLFFSFPLGSPSLCFLCFPFYSFSLPVFLCFSSFTRFLVASFTDFRRRFSFPPRESDLPCEQESEGSADFSDSRLRFLATKQYDGYIYDILRSV